MIDYTKIKTITTHSDRFHADDVFAGAMFRKLLPDVRIQRSRDPRVINKADLVFDVGGVHDDDKLRFDHHQLGSLVRENGIPYSAFGLLWRKFGVDYCDGDRVLADKVDQRLVQAIDADDNGVSLTRVEEQYGLSPVELPNIIGQLNPLDGSDEDYDTQYQKAVDLAESILRRFVEVEKSLLVTARKINEAYARSQDKRLIVLDETLSFKGAVDDLPELLYIVMPYSRSSKWGVVAISESLRNFEARKPLPAAWAGLLDQELAEITGVDDATFCHKKRFLVIALTKSGALKLADQAIAAT